MAATGIGNPLGAVIVADFGNPRILSGKAGEVTVSGGVFVQASGANNVVGSGTSSFATTDLKFVGDASGLSFNGICMQDVGSNGNISVATEGVFLLEADNTVTAGTHVLTRGNNSVGNAAANANQVIGRALTAAASGGFAVVHIYD